jgi:hypothetical protein
MMMMFEFWRYSFTGMRDHTLSAKVLQKFSGRESE